MFGVAFLYARSLWFLFIVEVPPCGWGWAIKVACPGFLVREACISVLVGGTGSLLSGATMKCPVVSFEMSRGLV